MGVIVHIHKGQALIQHVIVVYFLSLKEKYVNSG